MTGKHGEAQPSQIAIRSSGLSSHSTFVTDGIQLGSPRNFATFSMAAGAFRSFWTIKITMEFLFVGMAATTQAFIFVAE
jgi:hypothetical protein